MENEIESLKKSIWKEISNVLNPRFDIGEFSNEFLHNEDIPRIRMKHLEAELGKLAHNAYIATKVTFTVEIERLADHFGVDPRPVMETVWRDRRVMNSAHLTPRLGGFAGKCVPKDTAALARLDPDPESLLHSLSKRGSDEIYSERMKEQ